MQRRTPPDRWTIVVPLKSSARGKSRIDLDPLLRRRLALAMAMDTVDAATAAEGVGAVLVVVEDAHDGDRLAEIPGVRVHLTRTTGLNQAIAEGLGAVGSGLMGSGLMGSSAEALPAGVSGAGESGAAGWAAAGHPGRLRAVLPGDLPSLTADELSAALAAAAANPLTVVADRQGSGTTLLAATSAGSLRPRYGPGSLRRHQATGAVALDLPVSSGLRRDVDHAADLPGVSGPRTLAVLESAGLLGCGDADRLCSARPAG